MPERSRTESLRAGRPVRVGAVVMVAIERVVVRADRAGLGIWVTAAVEPHAIVVRDPDGARAVEVDGAALSVDALRESVPGLDGLLSGSRQW